MEFFCQHPPGDSKIKKNTAYLDRDKWNDFGFRTSFSAYLVDDNGTKHDLGAVRIMTADMTNDSVNVDVPSSFNNPLPEKYCSLGVGQNYYETLYALPSDIRKEYLRFIRDCAFDLSILHEFKYHHVMRKSLLRDMHVNTVIKIYHNILKGDAPPTRYRFAYHVPSRDDENIDSLKFDFKVFPRSMPSTNVHAIIGSNGVGKTCLFAGMASALIGGEIDLQNPLRGKFSFGESSDASPDTDIPFANVVTVAFSAFDNSFPFQEYDINSNIRHDYVGLKKQFKKGEEGSSNKKIDIKSPERLTLDFVKSFRKCLGPLPLRRERWLRAMNILAFNKSIKELKLTAVFSESNDEEICEVIKNQFHSLSSGHKIVVLTITRLVELVDDRTLVLIDEPESHLHPPLLSSFIQAVSDLLTKRNGVGIFATHSPVVLQEIPKSCVTIMKRSDDTTFLLDVTEETFAENIGALTREVFGLEITESGYYRILKKESNSRTYDEVLDCFRGRIGAEGRAIVHALTSRKSND